MKRIGKTLGYWLLISVVAAWAQETRRAGLWLISSQTRIQQSGESQGNFETRGNSAPSSPEGGSPVCLTREMVDSYGVILPPSLKDCQLSNVLRTADSFKADMTCKGGYNGVGSVESTWTDPGHVVGKIRFVAKSRGTSNENARQMRWTEEATAVFKSSDCGAVKPRVMPAPVPSK